MRSGSLTIVGTGIKFAGHMTTQAHSVVAQADKVLFAFPDPATIKWITQINPTAESFHPFAEGKPRRDTFNEWVDVLLGHIRNGRNVCAVFFGHPGVCVYPSHEAISRARLEGFQARMLPGISAEDCLYADLGLDPIRHGCLSFEATEFLIYRRTVDPSCMLILWQLDAIGELAYVKDCPNLRGLRVLAEVLEGTYGLDHEVIIYEAAIHCIFEPRIQRVPLAKLPGAQITPFSTLYIPPKAPPSLNLEIMSRLGIPRSQTESIADPSTSS